MSSGRVTWRELQGHAAFPVERTTVTEETIDLPIGRVECLRYDTRDDESASGMLRMPRPRRSGSPATSRACRCGIVADARRVVCTTVLAVEVMR